MDDFESPDDRGCTEVAAWQCNQVNRHEKLETIAEEVPVEFVYNGRPHAVMMASPTDLEDFAKGFSISEGYVDGIHDLHDVHLLRSGSGYSVRISIPPALESRLAEHQRNLEGRGSCGLCGSQSIDTAIRSPRRVAAGIRISPAALCRAMQELSAHQRLNRRTGSVHAAGWADPEGRVVVAREDVGRHNALDKLAGALSAGSIDAALGFVVLTSRASYELVLKAACMGVTILATISGPTALACEMADEAGLTLIGFARDRRCTVYTRPGRLLATPGLTSRAA